MTGGTARKRKDLPLSETDSFIEEVTEEVRRDRLFSLMRKYGWIVLLAIALIVGGAAFNEWRKARAEAEAEAAGDAILAALRADDPATALAGLAGLGGHAALTGMLTADAALRAGDTAGALRQLEGVAARPDTPRSLRDLARLKALMLADPNVDPAALDAALTELAAPGAPFRLMALEQKAVALTGAGKTSEAVTLYAQILAEPELTPAMRQRVSEMMVTLGADPEQEAQMTLPAMQ